MAMSSESKSAGWDRLLGSLGLARLVAGKPVETKQGAPRLKGIVEHLDTEHEELFVRLEEPTSGVAHLLPIGMGDQVCMYLCLYLYGAQAGAVASRETPVWQGWISEVFPPADAAAESAS